MNASIASPTRALRAFAWWAKAALWLVLGLWTALSLTWGVLHLVIVPRLDQWRPQLESLATRALGVKVTVGDLQAQTESPIPTFELLDVRLYDGQGREALRLDRITAGLSVRSVWRLGFEQLVVEAPALDIRRTADGRILVAGLTVAGNQAPRATDPANVTDLTNWLFSQPELLVRQGTLRWTDEARPNAPPLELRQLDAVLRNEGRLHQLRIDATPPEGWGQRVTLQAQMRHPLLQTQPGHWSSWTGTVYGEFPLIDLRALRQHVDLSGWLGLQVEQGQGALRLWADVAAGEVTDVLSDVALNRLDLRWLDGDADQPTTQETANAVEPTEASTLALRGLLGRLEMARTGSRLDVTARNLRFSTADGQSWPGGNLSYTQRRHPQTGRLERLDVSADQIDLAALQNVVQRLPPNEAWAGLQAWGAELEPSGLLQGLQVRWESAAGTPVSWHAAGRVTGLSLKAGPPRISEINPGKPLPGRPGVAGANAQFDLRADGGRAQLQLDDGHVEFPGVWAEPRLPLTALNAELRWSRTPDGGLLVEVPTLSWANAELSASAQGSWRTSDPATAPSRSRYPGVLDLQAQVASLPAARVQRFLPVGLPEPVRRYVAEAVGAGTVRNVSARVRGDLWQFPFQNPADGEFTLQAALDGMQLDYVPPYLREEAALPWPALQGIQGQLNIDRVALQIQGSAASAQGLPGMRLPEVTARIANFMEQAVVEVNGALEGPAAEALALVNGSPLRAMTNEVLARATIDGRTSARLRLELPLDHLDATRVSGSVRFAGNALRVQPGTPELRNTTGELRFTESGFEVRQASADMLGGRLLFDGDMRRQPAGPASGAASGAVSGAGTETLVQFRGTGTATAEGLRAARDLTPLARLADQAEGSAAYRAVLGFRNGRLELNVDTDLQGMAVNLPPPLNKAAQARLPLRLENVALPVPPSARSASVAPPERDRVALQIGAPERPLGGAVFEREFQGGNVRVLRGDVALGVGEFAALPARGVRARASLGDIDIGVWQTVFAGGTPDATPGPASGPAPASSPASVPASSSPPAWQAYWPTDFSIDARRLHVEGHTFNELLVGGTREGGLWRGNVEAQELSGYVEYQTREPGRLYARLARLVLASASASRVESFLQQQPASIPTLDVAVESFELSGRKLGQLVVQATNRPAQAEAPPEWRLTRLALTAPEARFEASGNWVALGVQRGAAPAGSAPAPLPAPMAATAAPRRTVLNFKLDVDESGALLERFGMPGVLRGGKGTLEGTLGWLGSPMGIHYPTLGGQMKLALERGQFLKADPGIAKLLGVLSLQSLPRRLVLDFRDVFSDGFAFDFVRGDARVEQGVLSTNNLQMKGVNAGVLLEGSADLAQETQDITAVVVPDLNTGTASLIATIINPATGIGSLLAQYLLRQPLQAATTQTFHITGPWADPVVERVVRRAAEPAGTVGAGGASAAPN